MLYVRAALSCLTVMLALPACAGDARDIQFPEQRQAIKVVFGEEGSDLGDYAGRGSTLVAHMQALGLSLTRVGIAWADCENTRGQDYDWNIPDRMINFLNERGIEPLVVLFSCPEWARTTHPEDEQRGNQLGLTYAGLQMPLLGFEEDYARWAEAVARRYRGKVRYYEFWNEPDGIPGPVLLRDKAGRLIGGRTGGDPVLYAHWLAVVHEGLKRGDPDMKLGAGSLSVMHADFMEAVYAVAGKDAFEAISYHPYAADGIHLDWLRQLRGLSLRYGDPDCEHWLTEYAWTPIADRGNPTMQYGCGGGGETVPLAGVTTCAKYPFVTQLYMHTLNDWGADPGGPLPYEGFGLLNLRLEQKPKYEEYRQSLLWRAETLSREKVIRGPSIAFPGQQFRIEIEPSLAGDVGDVDWFVPEGWTITASGSAPKTWAVLVPLDAAGPDPYPVSAKNARGYAFTRYVEVVEPVQIENVLVNEGARSGAPASVVARLHNLSDALLKVRIGLDLPNGWTANGPIDVECPPNGPAEQVIAVDASGGVAPGVYPAKARISLNGRQCAEADFGLPREAGCRRAEKPKNVDGGLGDWDSAWWVQVPGEGAESEFAIEWDDNYFYVAVRIQDEVHYQTKPIRDAWREDSIQLAFDTLLDAVPGAPQTLDDHEIILALGKDGPAHYRYSCPPDSYGGKVDGLDLAVASRDGYTVYEIGIPWEELAPAKPDANNVMGFCLVVNDNDGSGRRAYSWGDGVVDRKSPLDYGRIRLVRF